MATARPLSQCNAAAGPPLASENHAEILSQAEALLRDMAFVCQAAQDVKKAILEASAAPGQQPQELARPGRECS
jgi:hypothetical protein